eukprot:CAMPEP_0170621838 /NCGR_PEP_ID=MMETSP0224-20130122/28811_1 /TAXON_ID=285029 /ORGANISM="Togula jolla, Strain CCCM 725" /LENGTH=167 /DNA_ID=CAMNT_0010948117 /DNA_START=185 /DNA_END=689 /DNA_ORIENTATION=+
MGSVLADSLLIGVGAVAARGLRVLTADANAPVVAETTVEAHTLHSLKVLAKALIEEVGILLTRLSIFDIALPVEHPSGDLELERVADHSDHLIDLVGSELSGTLVKVNVALLADDVRETAANTLDGGEGIHDLLPAIHVGVAHTQDVLEVLRLKLDRHGFSALNSDS